MDKKDIYEHLASIYLDASAKRKTKHKKYSPVFKNLFFASIAVIVLLGVFLFSGSRRNQPHHSEVALLLSQEPVKINFHFDPAKKEIFSLNLNKLNTQRFNELVFSLKKINSRDAIKLKVEFANLFKERSE
ncbi:MAG: hypothetical protein KBA46_05570, partial [Candidatus Omnitrophica bacterium]|nr:hypothetical protein [Candidatus Omnitrophota bacterium]